MKTTDWRKAPMSAAMWRRNAAPAGWMRGTREEKREGGDNYAQMIDDEEIVTVFGVQDGESLWMRCERQADGNAIVTVRLGRRGKVVFTQELKKKAPKSVG